MSDILKFKLPTQLILFFNLGNARLENNVKRPSSVMDFMTAVGAHDPQVIRNVCQTFINEGLLIPTGATNTSPITGETFYNFGADKAMIYYGSYDFIAYGFSYIREHFINSVRPVIVKTNLGIDDIGTCFYIGDNKILTAKHCIENMQNIYIPAYDEKPAVPKALVFPKDENVDIALIEFEGEPFKDIPAFQLNPVQILDEVLTMGYPPIPGFDAIQFAEISRINAHVKSSRGNVVGKNKSYLDRQDYLLINAKVKGGNSGGPVINRTGFVGGMLVHIPTDPEDSEKLDTMGYGVAIPVEQLNAIHQAYNNQDLDSLINVPFNNSEKGFSTL